MNKKIPISLRAVLKKKVCLLSQDDKCKYDKTKVVANDTGFVDVTQGSEDDLQSAVATIGPVSVAIDASQDSFQLYRSGVYDEPDCSRYYSTK